MRVLVTGGAGFIGSHLVERLLADGEEPVVFDNLATGRLSNLEAFNVEKIEGDVRSRADVRLAMRGVNGVLHVAALPSVARSWQDPVTTLAVNAQGTAIVVEEAIAAGVERLVYSSSSSIYGDQEAERKVETLEPRPISPYGFSKLLAEQIVNAHGASGRIGTIALRYFNVFGSRQDPDSPYSAVIPKFITAAVAAETAVIYGDGLQSRDFTFVENVVEANLLALRSAASGVAVNIASGESRTLLDLVDSISAIAGRRLAVEHAAPRAGEILHSLADISLADEVLGYRPLVTFTDGLDQAYGAYAN
jgi:nucleoside-diphosphate-sugar epimerase